MRYYQYLCSLMPHNKVSFSLAFVDVHRDSVDYIISYTVPISYTQCANLIYCFNWDFLLKTINLPHGIAKIKKLSKMSSKMVQQGNISFSSVLIFPSQLFQHFLWLQLFEFEEKISKCEKSCVIKCSAMLPFLTLLVTLFCLFLVLLMFWWIHFGEFDKFLDQR